MLRYGPNLAESKYEPICYNDLILILVTLIIYFAIKWIKRDTTFQTKSPIAAQSDWWHCHRKIVKSGLKFSQKNFIRRFGKVGMRKVVGSNPVRAKLSKFPDWTKDKIAPFVLRPISL